MNQQRLFVFIQEQRSKGVADSDIRMKLKGAGWFEGDIEAAMEALGAPGESASQPVPGGENEAQPIRQEPETDQPDASEQPKPDNPMAQEHARVDDGIPSWHKSAAQREAERETRGIVEDRSAEGVDVRADAENGPDVDLEAGEPHIPVQPGGNDSGTEGDGFEATGNLGFKYVLGTSWEIFRQRWLTFFLILLPPWILSFLWGVLNPIPDQMVGQVGMYYTFTQSWPVLLLAFVVSWLVQAWSGVSLLIAVLQGEGVGVKEAYRGGLRMVVPFVLLSFLVGMVTLGGMLVFIIPGILFALWYMMAPLVYVDEGYTGTAALMRSKQYVRGHLGRILLNGLLFGLLVLVVMVPVMAVSGVIAFLLKGLVNGLSQTVQAVVNVIFLPFASLPAVFNTVMFKEIQFMHRDESFEVGKRSKVFVWLFALLGLLIPVIGMIGVIWAVGQAGPFYSL